MSEKNLFTAMITQMQQMAQSAQSGLDPRAFETMVPLMPKDAMERLFGNAVNEGGLDARTRLLLTIAGRHALRARAKAQEITEAITMMGAFVGLPASGRGLEIAADIFKEGDVS